MSSLGRLFGVSGFWDKGASSLAGLAVESFGVGEPGVAAPQRSKRSREGPAAGHDNSVDPTAARRAQGKDVRVAPAHSQVPSRPAARAMQAVCSRLKCSQEFLGQDDEPCRVLLRGLRLGDVVFSRDATRATDFEW